MTASVDSVVAKVLRLGPLRDGDLVVVSSDGADEQVVRRLADQLLRLTGKRFGVVVLPTGDDITAMGAAEARALLERLAAS